MTVKELLAALSDFDPESPVCFEVGAGSHVTVDKVEAAMTEDSPPLIALLSSSEG